MRYSTQQNQLISNNSNPAADKNLERGFSFIELMITITILVILTGVAIPSFTGLMARNKVTVATNAVFESLYIARSYAITQQKKVHVCHMSEPNSMTCSDQRDYNTPWTNGWLVYADLNDDNDYDQGDSIIRVMQSSELTNVVFNQQGRLRFFPDGSARSAGFYVCDQQQQSYRHVYLLYSGRARVNQSLSAKQKSVCDAA